MCDNGRECSNAVARGFTASGFDRSLDDVPDASLVGGAPASVRPARSLADKLGVKPGSRVSLVGVHEPAVADAVRAHTADVSEGEAPRPTSSAVIFEAADTSVLRRLPEMRDAITRDGMVWVLWPKGVSAIKQGDVQGAGLAAGLVDVKVARVSDALSGLKFVFRVTDR